MDLIFRDIPRQPYIKHRPKLPEKYRSSKIVSYNENQVANFLATMGESELLALSMHNAALWISLYIKMYGNLYVDKKPFNWDHHRYLIPVYSCSSEKMVVMKAAQMCFTTWLMLDNLHFLITLPEPAKSGIYFPTKDSANVFAKDRFSDLLSDNTPLLQKIGYENLINPRFKEGQLIKRIGPSSLYISYMGGKVTQDSTPLDSISLDEVRLIDPINFPRVKERLSHSRWKRSRYVSTAGYNNVDIHSMFLSGTQNFFHSKCGCGRTSYPGSVVKDDPSKWVMLAEHWPDCIYPIDKEDRIYGYRCPRCNYRIIDPQHGMYIPRNPEADYASFHVHQMLSHEMTPYQILSDYYEAEKYQNLKEWYNGKLGLPYIDEENRPITLDDLKSCEKEDVYFGPIKSRPKEISMGVDQRSGQNHVVISQRVGSRIQIIHLEVIDQTNPAYLEKGEIVSPFKRCCRLMHEFDVDICICDREPNTNDAMAFGREFPGKVWLMKYADYIDEPVLWADRLKGLVDKPQVRKSRKEVKYKWVVKLNRYTTIERTLKAIKDRNIIIPNSKSLYQYIRDKYGKYIMTAICQDIYFKHMTSIVRVVERSNRPNNPTGNIVTRWQNLGLDPHFLHATNYSFIGLERIKSFDFSFM